MRNFEFIHIRLDLLERIETEQFFGSQTRFLISINIVFRRFQIYRP